MSLISIIIPVYNTEKYIRKCLDSVINQTYKELEIVCINDGSTDKSLDVLNEYAKKDSRIKVFDIDNHGVSYARNLGLEKITGEYVVFIDSDDYISEKYCEDGLKNIIENNSDLVCYGKQTTTFEGNKIFEFIPKQDFSTNPIDDYKNFTHFRTVTQKMFKSSIIKNNNITFDTNFNLGEDCMFLIQYLTKCSIITSLKSIYYTNIKNPDSLTQNPKFKKRRIEDRKKFEVIIKKIIDDYHNSRKKQMIDFVYLIKPGCDGKDLRYSLRSIAKWYPNHKVWIVGYKPPFVQNVNYLPIEEKNEKWKNLVADLIDVCKNPDISEDFIYMNDDFFAIKPSIPLEEIIDSNMGLLKIRANQSRKCKTKQISWRKAFPYVEDLLKAIGIEEPLYDYEAHLPLKINKKKFLEVMDLPEVKKFLEEPKVLHYRTLYKNYDKPQKLFSVPKDVKILTKDITKEAIKVCGWLSVADDVVGNWKFTDFNSLLSKTLSVPCKYETQTYNANNIPKPQPVYRATSKVRKKWF